MIVKEVIDYISLHPGTTRDEITQNVLHEKNGLLKDLKTRRPVTYFNGILDVLIEMKIVDVDGPTEPRATDKYPTQKFYLSGNINYIYGVAFGTTSQIINLKCPICESENQVNPLKNPGKEKTCRNCQATLFPPRLKPKKESEAIIEEGQEHYTAEDHKEK